MDTYFRKEIRKKFFRKLKNFQFLPLCPDQKAKDLS